MRTIFVDSRDRVSGSPCDFSIQLPQTLNLSDRRHRMRVDLLRLPICIPTIQGGKNDTLQVQLGSSTYTITIPQGQYEATLLAARIQTLLTNVAPGSWVCTYDISNISLYLSCSNSFSIVGGTYAAQLLSRAFTQTSSSYLFKWVPMTGEDMVFLTSSTFSNLDNVGPAGSSDCILPCVVTASFGAVQEFNSPYDVWHDCPGLTTQQLSFSLRDRKYNLLTDFIPNISFLLTID